MLEKIKRICQNRSLNKYTQFLFMHFSISSTVLYSVIQINAIHIFMVQMTTCTMYLFLIIMRIYL